MNAFWITPKKIIDGNVIYRFTKKLSLSSDSAVKLSISADTRYKLYFNGSYVCEGPCQGDHWFWRYETVNIPPELIKDGENLITVDVLYVSEEIYFTQAKRKRAALIVFGESVTNGVTEEIYTTGATWDCDIIKSHVFIDTSKTCKGVMSNIPPMASYTLEEDENVGAMDYKRCWHDVGNHTPYGLADDYRLAPREIKLIVPEPQKPFTLLRRDEVSTELDAGLYTTAFPVFNFKGERGKKIRFIYAESYTDKEGSKIGVRRDLPADKLTGVYDEITFTGEKQTYEAYFYKAFRYVRAEYPQGTEFDAAEQGYKPYFYPVTGEGEIKATPLMEKMWEVSVNTLRCCTHETFVDCPYYEQCQYDMDTAIEMMVMMRLTNDYSMPRKAVYDLARSQQPDGMLCAHYPTSWVQIIPNFSLFWILMLRDYVTYSGDIKAIRELMPTVEGVLNAFELLKTEEGLVGSTPYWNYTDWVPEWSRGVPPMGDKAPTTVAAMMYAYALGIAAELAKEIGRIGLADEYVLRRKNTIDSVNKYCYDSEKQFYVDTYGYKTYSEHTAVWAVLSECVVGEEARELLDRSFTMNVSRASFSFGYYTFRALEKAGYYEKYCERLFDGWYRMLELGCTTWCENPDAPRSECHAWSSAPVYEYSAVVLGVRPVKNGFEEVIIQPALSLCNKISGTVPTPRGNIRVEYTTENGSTELKASVPNGVKATVILGEKRETFCGGSISVTS